MRVPAFWNLLRGLTWILWLAVAPAWADAPAPQGALQLVRSDRPIAAWPAIKALEDPGGALDASEAIARLADFKRPDVPTSNFGVRRYPVWLHLPLAISEADDGRWMLSIDYPLLNEADVTVWQRGSFVASFPLGSALPYDHRVVPGRLHVAELHLQPGESYDVLVRLRSHSSMIAPIALQKPVQLVGSEYRLQLLYGLWFGIALALIGYSVAHWVTMRDRMFLMYALLLMGISLFFVAYSGLGQQHLWNDQSHGLMEKVPPLGALLAITAGGQFIARALRTRERGGRLHAALMLQSLVGGVALLGSLAGLLDYRASSFIGTVMGGYSAVLAVLASWMHVRQARDAVGGWMLAGWSCYLAGALIQAGLLRGLVPAEGLTINLLQITTLCEMLAWQHVLGLRIEAIREQARLATAQQAALQSLAHTDPLTGLLNRRGLAQALAATEQPLALYLLDLDGFKPVNDRHGHDVGDALLVAVAERLRSLLRPGAVVARLGGDEFVVLTQGFGGATEAAHLGERLLRGFDKAFDAAGLHCEVGATIGYALAPHDARDGDALMKAADQAMYLGKASGGRSVRRAGAPLPGVEAPDREASAVV